MTSSTVTCLLAPLTEHAMGFAGAEEGLYATVNDGRAWHIVDFIPPDPVQALEQFLDGSGRHVVLVGTQTGLQRSADGGRTWRATYLGGAVSALAVAPHSSAVLAAASGTDLYLSDDGGLAWRVVAENVHDVLALEFSLDGNLYVATAHDNLRVLNPGAEETLPVEPAVPAIVPVSVTSEPAGVVSVLTLDGRVHSSGDSGSTWSNSYVGTSPALNLAGHPGGGQAWVSTAHGLRRENAAGVWSPVEFACGEHSAVAVLDRTRIVAANTKRVAVTSDLGDTWRDIADLPPHHDVVSLAASENSVAAGLVFALIRVGTDTAGVSELWVFHVNGDTPVKWIRFSHRAAAVLSVDDLDTVGTYRVTLGADDGIHAIELTSAVEEREWSSVIVPAERIRSVATLPGGTTVVATDAGLIRSGPEPYGAESVSAPVSGGASLGRGTSEEGRAVLYAAADGGDIWRCRVS